MQDGKNSFTQQRSKWMDTSVAQKHLQQKKLKLNDVDSYL